MYFFWKFVHIAGVLGFVGAHGATAAVAFRLRSERDPVRIRALLDLSKSTRTLMYASLLVLIAGGIETGFALHAWGQAWLSLSVVLLIVLLAAAFPLAVPYYVRVRKAVAEDSGVSAEDLDRLLSSPRPVVIAVVETAGILVIAWLMIAKPF